MQKQILNHLFTLQNIVSDPRSLTIIERCHVVSEVAMILNENLTWSSRTDIMSRLNTIVSEIDSWDSKWEVKKRIDKMKILITDILMALPWNLKTPSIGLITRVPSSPVSGEDKWEDGRVSAQPATSSARPSAKKSWWEDWRGWES